MPDTAGNSLATATSLNLTSASQSFPDLVTPVANDYYRFVLSAPSSLNLSLTGLDANANVELLDGSGNLVSVDGVPQRSANSSTFSEAINTTLNPGLYYIRVSPDVTVSQANYTLNVTAQDNLLSRDLLWRPNDGSTGYWYLDGTTYVSFGFFADTRPTNWSIGALGDLNGDGNTDIIWRDAAAGLTDVWFMNGATLLSSTSIFPSLGADWRLGGVGDFNQDGRNDLLWQNPNLLRTDIWFMNGSTLLSSVTIDQGSTAGWEARAVGDFNKDGNPDILWYNPEGQQPAIWILNSKQQIDAIVVFPQAPGWELGGAGDFNQDGSLDFIWHYKGLEGTVAGWFLDRTTWTGIFYLPSVDPSLTLSAPFDTYGTPNPIDLAGNSSATAFNLGQNVLGSATYRDRVDGLTDSDDYYQFSITNTARVSLSLAGLGADLDLQLFNNRGQEIGFSSQVGNSPESIISQLDAGTYYIRVLPFSANDSSTYALSINVNTPPVLVTNNVLTLSEQGTASLSNAVLRVTDADNLPTEVVYTVSELPLNGTLFVGGVAVVAGSTFTEADVDAGNRIQYVHNGSETTSDRFTFSVTDNAGGAIGLTTFSFAVTPVNDPPSIVSNLGLTVSEGAQGSINAALLQLTDVDSPLAGLTYSITALPTNGTLLLGGTTVTSFTQADLASGNLSYRHNGGETTSDRFTFVASDGAGAALTSTFSITVLAVNDPPVLVLPTGTQAVDQQTNTLLSGISITDVDLGTGEYTVTVSAGNGVLTLGRTSGITFLSGDGTQDSSFSFRGPQAVTNFVLQSLIYRSNNGFRGSDTVNITVSDGGNTGLGGPLSASGIISLSVAPVNDAPVLTAPTAQTVLEDVTTPISGIVVGDLDSGSGLLEVSLTAANGTLSLNSTSGINLTAGTGSRDRNLVFTGSLDAVNAVLAGLTYQGDRNFNGADQLRISVSDRLNGTNGIPLSDTKIVSLTVTAVNDAPILTVPGAQQVNENSDLRVTGINVTDVDATGDLTVNLFASSGRLSLSSTAGLTFDAGNGTQNEILSFRGAQAAVNDALRTLLYRANTDFNGSDTITLNVTDGGGTGIGGVLGDSKTIAVNVVGINNPPAIAVPSTPLAVDSDTNLAINGVRITDPDANGGILSVTLLAQNGVLSLSNTAGLTFTQGNGNQNNRLTFTGTLFAINTALSTITYRSYPGFTNAFDRITLQVNDNGNTGIGIPLSDAKTLLVNVGGAVNRPPVASNDAFSVAENAPLNGGTVLANDNDPDFTLPLTAQLVASPANALSFTLNPNGTFSYTPTLNYNGVDTFTYRAIDALGGASNTATVAITVTPVNNAPVALSDGPYTIAAGGTLTVTGAGVLSNDTDVDTPLANLTASLVTAPGNGTLSLNPNGSFTYRPTGSFAGIDRFTYVASDGSLTSNLATVTISVGANNAPIANPDNFTLGQNGTLTTGSVLTNDTDADNNLPLSATLAIAPTNALSFTLNPDGTFRYQPRTNFIGTDTFVYRAIDSLGAISSNSATVTFSVSAVNQAPVALNDTLTVTAGTPLTITAPGILVNDTDFENSPLTATLVATTNNGTLSLNPNGSFVYTPNAGFTGTDIFTYRANDGSLSSANTATVSLLVGAAPNQLPIANPDTFTTPENTPLAIGNALNNPSNLDLQRVSVASNGSQGGTTANLFNAYYRSALSGDGRYVVFSTDAGGLMPQDTNSRLDIYLRDRQTGTITLISTATGGAAATGDSYSPAISADGRYIAFYSNAANINAQGLPYAGLPSVYLYDRQTGVTTRIASGTISAPGNQTNSRSPSISSNGRYIAYDSGDSIGSGTVGSGRVFVYDQQTSLSTQVATGVAPRISDDGRYVAYQTEYSSISGNQLLLLDRQTGQITTIVGGAGPSDISGIGELTPDGRYLSFTSYVPNLVAGDTNSNNDAFVYDRQTGQISLVSVNSNGVQGNADSFTPSISADGRYVSFHSLATNLAPDSTSGLRNVFVRDRLTGKTILVSNGSNGVSFESSISANGRFVSFASDASNLISGDTNNGRDVYVANVVSSVLANDVDPDGNLPLTATLATSPANALSFTLNPDGSFVYQPRTNFSGVDSFVYRAIDSLGAISSAGATVTINVTSVTNTAPVVLNDNYTVATTASLAITAPGVLANDTDAEGSALTATLVATTPNGTLSLNPNGAFVYQPNAGFTGIDSFTYRANDGSLNSPNVGTANITVSISGTNAAPIANPDIFTTQRNTSLTTGSVLTNDTDPEGSPLTASVIAAPANALSFTLNPNGTFNYLPTLNFVGTDTFTYVAVDALGARSQTATVTFSVTGSNTAPVANNETFSVLPAGTLNITLPGVLANDTDAENNPLTATLIAAPSNAATFTLNANGSFTYIPQTGFSGSDRFTYVANDGTANSNTATVTISVSTNQIPTAVSDSFTVPFNTSFTVGNVLSNDTDPDNNVPLTASVVAAPTNALSFTLRPDGGFSYVPNLNFSGTDTFTYVAIDSLGGTSNPTTATFSVTPGNRPPLVSNDTVAVNSGSSLTITAPGVLRNDTDPDGNALTASISANATRGTVALNSDGSFVYTPNPGFFGTDSFTYLANDGTVNSTPATVTIRVNAPPVAVSDTYTAAIGGPLNVASLQGVLANDTDPDGPGLTASVLTGPAQGTLALNPNGSFIYTSNTGASGVDTFTYVATDGLASSTATVTLSLRTNNAPIAVNDSYRVATNGTLNVQPVNRILGNDSDPDAGTVLSATLVTEPTRGSLSLNPNGTFTYVPQTGFQGTDSFVYRASDGITLSNPATVTLSVSNNAPPVANNDTFTAFSGIPRNQFAPGVRANDTDANGDNLTIFLVSQPINGTVNLSSSGAFVYTANSTFQGVDTFVYRAFDGIDSSTATVTMSVTQNLPPVALPDVFGAIAGQTLTITAPGVLANDTDPENDPLSAIGNAIPTANGRVLSFNGDGSFTYLPNPGFAGVDSFTYVASDGISQSLATITINVAATNTPPVANPDNYRVNPNNVLIVPRTLGVLANDSDPNTGQQLSASVVTNPTQGVLSLNPNGSFVYTPNATAVGTDSFTYLASDGSLSSTAGVTITINTTSTPPTAQNDNFTIATNGTLTITAAGVLANDSDSNGDVIRSTLATNPGNGSVTLNPDGSFVYRPNASFQGTDSFTYLATDGLTNSTPATVFVTVGGANAAPVVSVPGSQLISQNSTLTIASGLSVNDPDAGSSPIQVTLSATNGTLTLSSLTGLTFTTGTGTANPSMVFTGAIANVNAALANLQLTPTAGFTGASQITLIANDQGANGTGGPQTGSGTVTVNVTNGATLVTNISPGASNSDPTNLVSVGNRVYFAATDGSTGVELWRSDGTAAATTRVADIDPGSAASTPTSLTVVGNFLYYTANTSTAGVELWRTDLTTGTGATLVRDIRPGIDSSLPQNLVNYANNLFFVATDGTGGLRQLWRVDSTGAAVKVLAGVNNVTNLTIAGSTLYFTAGGGTQLWRVDSPTATPVLVRNVGTGAAISNLTAVGDRLFFTARDTAGVELWSSDGTTANTNRVTDLNAGAADANPRSLVAFNGNLYFFAQDSAGGAFKLFQSTPTGVVSAIATLPSTGTAPAQLTVVGSRLFFVADAGTVANPNLQLWTSDGGTTASLVRDVNAAGSDQISSLTSFNGSLFFVANDGTGYRIFRSDGSAANTVAVSGTFTTPPNNLTVAGDRLLFSASDATNGSELWTVG